MRSRISSLVSIVWVVVGLIVASGHGYFAHLTAVMPILSAILAVLLWPLILLGVNLLTTGFAYIFVSRSLRPIA